MSAVVRGPRPARRGLAGAMVVAFALAGCGGDDSDGDGDGRTKQAYIAQVDRICADQDRISAELSRLDTEKPDDLTRLGRRVEGYLTGGVERIAAVPQPDDERARRDARAYIAALKRSAAPAREFSAAVLALADALRARDKEAERKAVNRIREATTELAGVEDTTDRLARRFGLARCGRDADADADGGGTRTTTAPSSTTD